MKGAILVHGWATDRHVWHKYWILDNEMPLAEMLESRGYRVIVVELPGSYLDRDKDFLWYSNYLGHVIRENFDLDEIVIIGHSMGGLVGRVYLDDEQKIFQEGRMRVSRLIMLGTPNHGTSVPHFDLVSGFLTRMVDLVLPWEKELVKGDEHNYFLTTPCYRDIQLGSAMLRELNCRKIPPGADQHVVYTNGDTVAEPQHTCILPGAFNHLVDRLAVNHFNMCYRQEVVEVVESILDGVAECNGIQDYPSERGCESATLHEWMPATGIVTRNGVNIWRCIHCGKKEKGHAVPTGLVCDVKKGRVRIHGWEKVGRIYRYRFRCMHCGKQEWHPKIPKKD